MTDNRELPHSKLRPECSVKITVQDRKLNLLFCAGTCGSDCRHTGAEAAQKQTQMSQSCFSLIIHKM